MAAFDAFLRLVGGGRGAQAISRVLPTPKERILQQLEESAPQFFSPERAQGATFDPRRARFLEAGVDRGQMMSPIKNMPENVVRNPQELLNFAQRPDVMPTLQRGGYMGSWFDPEVGGLVVDPSRRFATRTGALIQGIRSEQKAGFDLGRMEEFPVSKGELARQVSFLAPGAALGGVSGYAAGEETGVNPLLAGLAGAALGAAGGSAAARFARVASMAARRGAVTPDFLTGGLAGAGAAASRFKAAAANPKFAGVFGMANKEQVAQQTLRDILGGKRLTAPSPQDIAALPETGEFFQRLNLYTSPKLTKKDLALLNPETRAAMEAELPLDVRMLGSAQRGLGAIPETLPEGGYEIGSVFKQIGVKPISVGGKNWDLTKVSPQNVLLHYAQRGDLDGFAEAYSKMLNNQLSLYPEKAVKSIVDATDPEFYPVARDFILAVSEATNLPPHVVGIGLAAASQQATPTKEILRLIQAAKILVMKDGKAAINAKRVSIDGKQVWVTEDGVKIPEGQFTVNAAKAMVEVINNPAYAHVKIPGIANKTWLYNMSKFDPTNFGIYTNDSIDTFTLAGTTQTPLTISDFVQSLAGRSVGQGATRAQNLPGPSGQAVPWFVMRALRPDTSMIGESFSPGILDLAKANTKDLSNVSEVAEFARAQIDDLLRSGQLGSSYRMTDEGILVPNVTDQPGLLVPYDARNQASVALEESMGQFAKSVGEATRAAGTRGGKAKKAVSPEAKAAEEASKLYYDTNEAYSFAADYSDEAADLSVGELRKRSKIFFDKNTYLGRSFRKWLSSVADDEPQLAQLATKGPDKQTLLDPSLMGGFAYTMDAAREGLRHGRDLGIQLTSKEVEDLPALLHKLSTAAENAPAGSGSPYSLARLYVEKLRDLNKTEFDTFMSLLPEWVDTPDELVATAKALSFE